MINNRQQQAGRRRGRGGQGPGQGQRPQGGSGRPDNGNRIDNRARGNAAQLYEKYSALARDAQMQGDRVNIEYYLQFADHYFRVLAEQRGRFDEQQPRRTRDEAFEGDTEDYGAEGEPIRPNEQVRGEPRGNEQRSFEPRDGRPREGQRDGQREPQRDAQRDGPARRDGRREEWSGRDQQRDQGQREAHQETTLDEGEREPRRGEQFDERGERVSGEGRRNGRGAAHLPPAVANDVADEPAELIATPTASGAEQPDAIEAAPRRRGRPRREPIAEVAVEAAPMLDVDRLPPALGIAPVAADEPEEKPRRRRGRPPASEAAAS